MIDASLLLWPLALLLVVAGFVGMLLPVVPGAPLLFAGLVALAWAEDFAYLGWGSLGMIGVLAVLTWAVDLLAGAFGARRFGASGRAVVGAALGALAGLFFGLPGILLGPFVGAVLGELSAHGDLRTAGRAGFGAALGLALGAAAKLALGVSMLGLYLLLRLT